MDEKLIGFRVGVVVVASIIVAITLTLMFGVGFQSKYTLNMKFDEAPGVVNGTPIRKNGVLVGRVSTVELLDEGGVMITAEMFTDRKIKTSEIPRIGSASLFGDAQIEFINSGESAPPGEYYTNGDNIDRGVVSPGPLDALRVVAEVEGDVKKSIEKMNTTMDSIRTAAVTIDGAGTEVATLARNFNSTVGESEEQVKRILDKTEKGMTDFTVAMEKVNEIVGDDELRQSLKKSLEDLPTLFADAKATLQTTRDVVASFEKVSSSAEKNLQNLEGLTGPLGEKGEALVNTLDQSLRNVDELILQLTTFSRNLNEGDGTVKMLIEDRELYDKLNRAATNIEMVSRRLRPIMDDVRVFTDKIARDPRQLGAQGVLNGRPSGAGLKPTIGFRPHNFDPQPAFQPFKNNGNAAGIGSSSYQHNGTARRYPANQSLR